jgi:DNA-binding transcriptional ArsR family regulator
MGSGRQAGGRQVSTVPSPTAAAPPGGLHGAPDGFGEAGLVILRALLAAGPLAVSDLPHRWPLTRLHLRPFVERLVAGGLVARAGRRDGRGERLRLTPAGRRLAAAPHAAREGGRSRARTAPCRTTTDEGRGDAVRKP